MEMMQIRDFESCLASCSLTENDDVRDESFTKNNITDDGDHMERKLTSKQRPKAGSPSSIENEITKRSSISNYETPTSSKINFLCKPLAFLCQRHGLVLALLAHISFSLQSLFLDILTETLDSFQVVFMHVPILMMCCLVLIIYKGVRPSRDYKNHLWLLGSGTCQAGSTCFLTLSMSYLAVGDAVCVLYTSLIQVGFFSRLILKEPVRLCDIVFAILAFGGVIFIARPSFIFNTEPETSAYQISIQGVLCALVASSSLAMFFVFNRKLSKLGIDSLFCIFFSATTVVLLSGLVSVILNRWRCPTMNKWLYALLAGVFYLFGQMANFFALKVETATLVTVVATVEIVCAYLWQVIFLGLLPFWTSYIGAILIFASCIGITMKNKPPSPAPDQ